MQILPAYSDGLRQRDSIQRTWEPECSALPGWTASLTWTFRDGGTVVVRDGESPLHGEGFQSKVRRICKVEPL